MKKTSTYTIFIIYIIVLCLLFLLSVTLLFRTLKINYLTEQQTELMYIYVQHEETSDTIGSETNSNGWIIKAYEGKIGVFETDGTLIEILNTYIKTLPEADRRLLEEGIYAETKDRLLSLLEDYSE